MDDHDFEITHVVRAEEHLPNTARQIFILESLGYARPTYASVPYVAEPAGTKKLSKRKLDQYIKNKDFANLLNHGNHIANCCGLETDADTFNPVIVDFYREIGFAPDAILNYLLLLGWSLDGEREKFTVDEMIKLFSLDRVKKSPASFDPQKLLAFQGDAFAALPLQERVDQVKPFAERANFLGGADAEAKLTTVVDAAGDRLKIAGDIVDYDYCFGDVTEYDKKAFQKRLIKPADACELLAKLRDHLAAADAFDAQSLEQSVKEFCEQSEIGLGQVIHALRVATTGKPAGFGMFETLAVLGKETVTQRIDAALEHAATIRGDSDQ